MSGLNNWITFDNAEGLTLDFSALKVTTKKRSIDFAVKSITENYSNLHIALSGGLDSEFVANAFKERFIPFTPVLVDYYYNEPELWYAKLWCLKNNYVPRIIKIDKKDVEKVFSLYSYKHKTVFGCAVDFIINDIVEGPVVFGLADPFEFSSDFNKCTNTSLQLSSYDYSMETHYPGKHPGSFFTYTPELLFNMVWELDYSRPVQFSKAEYYSIEPRPKYQVSRLHEVFPHAARVCNKNAVPRILDLGHKDDFLEAAKQHSIYRCPFLEYN